MTHRQPHKATLSRDRLARGMQAVQTYEHMLTSHLIEGLHTVPGLKIWGITDTARLRERVSTVSFTLDGQHPHDIAKALGEAQIYVWSGNFYALEVTTALGLEDKGGLVRIGVVHYNTHAEIERLVEQLCKIAAK
jgi:selenocysteine lyase/cysteine desulfurase